jgi:hypothetical protein
VWETRSKPLSVMIPVSSMGGESWINLLDVSLIERTAVNGVTFVMKNGREFKAFGDAEEYRRKIREATQ